MSSPVTSDDSTRFLDPWHAAVVDAVMVTDAEQVAAKGHGVIRLAVEHEFCQPGQSCTTWPTVVMVVPIAPGIRLRVPHRGLVAA